MTEHSDSTSSISDPDSSENVISSTYSFLSAHANAPPFIPGAFLSKFNIQNQAEGQINNQNEYYDNGQYNDYDNSGFYPPTDEYGVYNIFILMWIY
jgi:hypothetical protein